MDTKPTLEQFFEESNQAKINSLQAQLSSKEQECEELKAKYAQLWGDWNSEQFSQTREENGNLRAENDRLKEKLNVWEEYVEVDIEMYQLRLKERDEARKRCEDLEAIRDSIIEITFGDGSHQERIIAIKDALKIQ